LIDNFPLTKWLSITNNSILSEVNEVLENQLSNSLDDGVAATFYCARLKICSGLLLETCAK